MIRFADVIGQEEAKARLRQMVEEDRVPHALLFCGPQGCGKMAMAMAFASYLMAMAPVLIVYIFAQKWVVGGVMRGAVK